MLEAGTNQAGTNQVGTNAGQVDIDNVTDRGGRLPTLVLDRETIRNLTAKGSPVEAVGKKKPKKTTTWPECGDTTTAKPECPIITQPGGYSGPPA